MASDSGKNRRVKAWLATTKCGDYTPRVVSSTPPTTKVPVDIDRVRRKLEQLAAEDRVSELIELVVELLVQFRDSNTKLSVRLQNALRELYGRKSQKVSTAQLSLLFAELGAAAPADALEAAGLSQGEAPLEEGPVPQPPEPPKPLRNRGGRSPLPEHLHRQTHVVPVPEAERVCKQCGQKKVCIGHKTSEILEFVPARFIVIEEKREKLACPRCPEEGVATAPSEKVMERGRPGPGLIAHIIVEKHQDSMPVERQSDACKREGVALSPSTLGDWSAFGLDVLAPVAGRLKELALGWFYVHTDDTGIPVLDRNHPNGVRRGHIWVFVGGDFPVFVYAPDWKAKHAAEALEGFKGYLQGDGYAGYATMTRGNDSKELIVPPERKLGCGMHIRSKFEKAMRAGDARGAIAIAYFKDIYRVEEDCKAEGLSPEERHERRQEESLPVVDKLFQWVHDLEREVVPNTLMYAAVTYAKNQEALWRRCFTDGRFEIDNGEAERQLRRVAIGRKNYLFAGSDKGAERLAVGYTVFAACRMHDVNPLAWATDVITKLQAGWPRSRLDELLPHIWARAQAAATSATNTATAAA